MFLRAGKMYENKIKDVWWPLYDLQDDGEKLTLALPPQRYLGFKERFVLLEICNRRLTGLGNPYPYFDVKVLTESGDIRYMLLQVTDNNKMESYYKEVDDT